MNRFLVFFPDSRKIVSFNTMLQVTKFLDSSNSTATTAHIFEHAAEAVRNKWVIGNGKTAISRNRIPWCPKDGRKFVQMRKSGKSLRCIAKELGRSVGSLNYYIVKYNLNCC